MVDSIPVPGSYHDGSEVKDVHNNTNYTLKAQGNFWDSQNIEGSIDASNAQGSANSDAGPGGALGKFARQQASTEEAKTSSPILESYGLAQNFPNPFNPSTVIRFRLPTASKVTLTIYDILGRQIRSLTSGTPYAQGIHTLAWDGSDDSGRTVASGVYVYRIDATGPSSQFSDSRKLVFIQ